MAPLNLSVALVALIAGLPLRAENVSLWRPYIAEASVRCGIPTRWIERVMQAESAGQTTIDGRPIRSRAGAIGLMQLMPATWATMRRELGLGDDPDDPRDNILAGTCYLRMMYDRFGYPGLFGAYNAGPRRYGDHLATGRPLPAETIGYLGAVGEPAASEANGSVPPPRDTLFVVRRRLEEKPEAPAQERPPSVFVVRHDGF